MNRIIIHTTRFTKQEYDEVIRDAITYHHLNMDRQPLPGDRTYEWYDAINHWYDDFAKTVNFEVAARGYSVDTEDFFSYIADMVKLWRRAYEQPEVVYYNFNGIPCKVVAAVEDTVKILVDTVLAKLLESGTEISPFAKDEPLPPPEDARPTLDELKKELARNLEAVENDTQKAVQDIYRDASRRKQKLVAKYNADAAKLRKAAD